MKKELWLLLIFFLLGIPLVRADKNFLWHPNRYESVFGIIQDIGLNTIEIYDENDKQVKRFVYLGNRDQWHKGQRVRIDYWTYNHVVANIKTMTSLEYKKDGQNLGYILK